MNFNVVSSVGGCDGHCLKFYKPSLIAIISIVVDSPSTSEDGRRK
jgi:hypothetical protein